MSHASYIDITRRFDSGTETLQDIRRSYHLYRSLCILLRGQTLCEIDIQTLVFKYANLHSLCATSFRCVEIDLNDLGLSHLLDSCMAVKNQVDAVVNMLQISRPRQTDTELQAAQWEVIIQKSMLRNRAQHNNFLRGDMATY
jgi:hypothetical protein